MVSLDLARSDIALRFIDTNILLRYLLDDVPSQADQVEKWFLEAKKGRLRLVVCTEILLEINYVLLRPLRLSKVQTVASLKSIVKLSFLEFEDKEPFLMALKIYERENMDLVDCFLFSKATMEDGEVLSFDKDYSRLGK